MYKKVIFILLILFALGGCLSTPPEENNKLVGSWMYENPAYGGAKILFQEDYTIALDAGGGSTFKGTYEVDWSKDPIELNIYWDPIEEGQDLGKYETIIEFLSDYKIIIADSDMGTPRPEDFNDKSETLVRVEEE